MDDLPSLPSRRRESSDSGQPVHADHAAVRLPGGNVAPVYRVGDTVRRSTGFWTPAVHALLQHLERVDFEYAPRVLGFDGQGREIFSYVEGFVPYAPDVPAEIWTDDALALTAALVRRYHDAVSSFQPPPDARWRFCPGAPRSGEIVCHNDLAPWNTVYEGHVPTAFIDWDFAAPAPALYDIAYVAWRFVPLYYDGIPAGGRVVDIVECARRLRLFCDEYGLRDRSGLLEMIERRQQVMFDTVHIWGEAGIPGFSEMWRTGHAEMPLRDLAFLRANKSALRAAL